MYQTLSPSPMARRAFSAKKIERSSPDVDNFAYTNAFVSFALNFAVKAVAEPSHTDTYSTSFHKTKVLGLCNPQEAANLLQSSGTPQLSVAPPRCSARHSGLTRRSQPTPPSGVPTCSEGAIFDRRHAEQVFSLTGAAALAPSRAIRRAIGELLLPKEIPEAHACDHRHYVSHAQHGLAPQTIRGPRRVDHVKIRSLKVLESPST